MEGGRAEESRKASGCKGKVVRLQPFGAFVELRPGVDGLIHISALSERRIAHPRDVVKVGEEVEVQVEKVDPDEKRVGLRLVARTDEPRRLPRRRRRASAAAPAAKTDAASRGASPEGGPGGHGQGGPHRAVRHVPGLPGRQGPDPGERDGHRARHGSCKRDFQHGPGGEGGDPGDRRQREDPPVHHRRGAGRGARRHGGVEQDRSPRAPGGKGFGTFADLLKGKEGVSGSLPNKSLDACRGRPLEVPSHRRGVEQPGSSSGS